MNFNDHSLANIGLTILAAGFIQSCGSSTKERKGQARKTSVQNAAVNSQVSQSGSQDQEPIAISSEPSVMDYLQSLHFYNQQILDEMKAGQNTNNPEGAPDSSNLAGGLTPFTQPVEEGSTGDTADSEDLENFDSGALEPAEDAEDEGNPEENSEEQDQEEPELPPQYQLTNEECSSVFNLSMVTRAEEYSVCALNYMSQSGLKTIRFVTLRSLCMQKKENQSLDSDPVSQKLCATVESQEISDVSQGLNQLIPEPPYSGFIRDLSNLCQTIDPNLKISLLGQADKFWGCAQF